eukprot:1672202-Alexandrium_andersonii.AAC.1
MATVGNSIVEPLQETLRTMWGAPMMDDVSRIYERLTFLHGALNDNKTEVSQSQRKHWSPARASTFCPDGHASESDA